MSVQDEDVAADISIMDGDGRSAQAAVAADDEADEFIHIMDDDLPTARPAVKPPAGILCCKCCTWMWVTGHLVLHLSM